MKKILFFSIFSAFLYTMLHYSGQFSRDTSVSYPIVVGFLLLSMGVILSGCELFANGVECIGDRLGLSHATSGSLLAAVGTALPETLLPILALVFGTGHHRESIAVGAILGAPFMLTTLAFFLVGTTSLFLRITKRRDRAVHNVNLTALKMELAFFIAVMTVIMAVSYIRVIMVNHVVAVLLLLAYALFVKITLNHGAEDGEEYTENFHFSHIMSCPPNARWITVQTATGLLLIVIGAHIFINFLTVLSIKSGISSLILSLLIAPVASELPEKFNSITWTIKKKDTLAVSNVTGAMVFQSTIPVAIGLLFTPWQLGHTELLNIFFSLLMASIVYITITAKRILPSAVLMLGGIFYCIYVARIFVFGAS